MDHISENAFLSQKESDPHAHTHALALALAEGSLSASASSSSPPASGARQYFRVLLQIGVEYVSSLIKFHTQELLIQQQVQCRVSLSLCLCCTQECSYAERFGVVFAARAHTNTRTVLSCLHTYIATCVLCVCVRVRVFTVWGLRCA